MRIRCPHCHSPIEVVDDASLSDLNCSSCGSQFSLIGGDTTRTYQAGQQKLGRFELLQQVGMGHFGTVWQARDTELDRTVAVKVPRKGQLDEAETEMFLREARAAAQLKHPGIVGVHEVGRDDQTVYIVSDYIDGATLKEWLTGQKLTIREAVELVVEVTEALDHAHQAGVVHRDMKPGNIMIDRDGRPHITDFGLAKREAGEITMTVEGNVLGTPAYMSPEQASGKGHEADARSDVYSLGVILFELLTGELPFRGEQRMLIVQILDEDAPSPRKLNARIPRDLETITLKCLEKEPSKRYASARELADDLKRYLAGEPIHARPVGQIERAWRWSKRKPAVAALSAAAAGLLVLVAVVSMVGYVQTSLALSREEAARREAEDERARGDEEQSRALRAEAEAHTAARLADSQAQTARAVSAFLIGMFEEPTPYAMLGMRVGKLELDPAAMVLLDRGARQLTEGLDDQPLVKAAMLAAIGRAHVGTGAMGKGATLQRQALDIHRRELPADDQQIADDLEKLSLVYFFQDRTAESEEFARENLRIRRAAFDESHEAVLRAKANLAIVVGMTRSNISEAERLWRDVLDARRKSLDPEDPRIAEAMVGLGGVLLYGRYQPAEVLALFAGGVKIFGVHEETRDLGVGITSYQRSVILSRLGNSRQALVASEDAYHRLRESLGFVHPVTQVVVHSHAQLLFESGRHEEARTILDALFARYQEHGVAFAWPEAVSETLRNFATLLTESGEQEKLEQILRRVLARQKELTAYQSRNTSTLLVGLVALLKDRGKPEDVQVLMDDYLATSNLLEDTRSLHDSTHLGDVIRVLLSADRFEDAATIAHRFAVSIRLHASVRLGDRGFAAGYGYLTRTLLGLARSLDDEGKAAEAEKIYRQAIALLTKLVADYPDQRSFRSQLDRSQKTLAAFLESRGAATEADARSNLGPK